MKKAKLREALKIAVYGLMEMLAVKVRDPREPERRAKAKLEELIAAAFRRRFRRQLARVMQQVQALVPGRKAIDDIDLGEDEEEEADIIRLILRGMAGGVELFRQQISIGLDYALVNRNAVEAARRYVVGQLIKGVDDTTRQVVRDAVRLFADTPGMTMGDLQSMLPFDARRAETIAVTEVTRAYAEGERLAGERLKEEYPDVPVVKKWYTNEDDKVCPLCGPLGDRDEWIPLDEPFDTAEDGEEIMFPPRHVNCRCWASTKTDVRNA